VYGLRGEYQERVNFVILDVDQEDERALAQQMGARGQPFYAVIPPGGGPELATQLRFGPLPEPALRELLDGTISTYAME
jgi:hypothetical protein